MAAAGAATGTKSAVTGADTGGACQARADRRTKSGSRHGAAPPVPPPNEQTTPRSRLRRHRRPSRPKCAASPCETATLPFSIPPEADRGEIHRARLHFQLSAPRPRSRATPDREDFAARSLLHRASRLAAALRSGAARFLQDLRRTRPAERLNGSFRDAIAGGGFAFYREREIPRPSGRETTGERRWSARDDHGPAGGFSRCRG